jgi:hypothetical protein
MICIGILASLVSAQNDDDAIVQPNFIVYVAYALITISDFFNKLLAPFLPRGPFPTRAPTPVTPMPTKAPVTAPVSVSEHAARFACYSNLWYLRRRQCVVAGADNGRSVLHTILICPLLSIRVGDLLAGRSAVMKSPTTLFSLKQCFQLL